MVWPHLARTLPRSHARVRRVAATGRTAGRAGCAWAFRSAGTPQGLYVRPGECKRRREHQALRQISCRAATRRREGKTNLEAEHLHWIAPAEKDFAKTSIEKRLRAGLPGVAPPVFLENGGVAHRQGLSGLGSSTNYGVTRIPACFARELSSDLRCEAMRSFRSFCTISCCCAFRYR